MQTHPGQNDLAPALCQIPDLTVSLHDDRINSRQTSKDLD